MQTTTYKLNVTPGGVPLTIHISQYDVGLRQYTFQPYTNVGEFTYVSGATVTLEATKPDGYGVVHECTYNQDGITYTLQEQLAAKPGRVWSKVVIRDGADVLGTGAVIWIVDCAGLKDDAIVSESDMSGIRGMIDDEVKRTMSESVISSLPNSNASGAVAHFTDGAYDIPVRDLKIGIVPKQSGSGDPSPSNIRPITGWTEATVTRTGKNMADTSTVLHGIPSLTTGASYTDIVSTNRYAYIPKPIKAQGGLVVTVYTKDLADLEDFFVLKYKNGLLQSYDRKIFLAINTPHSFVIPANTFDTIMVAFGASAADSNISLYPFNGVVQVEYGSIATTYEPYSGDIYTISLGVADTVYGGTLDVTTGVLTVDKKMITVDGTNVQMTAKGSSAPINYYFNTPDGYLFDMTGSGWLPRRFSNENYLRSDKFKIMYYTDFVEYGGFVLSAYIGSNGTALQPRFIFPDSANITTVAEANAWFASNPTTLVYPLATPTTYQLTPTEVKTLLGTNNIWADTGDTDVEYKADTTLYIDSKLNVTKSIIAGVEVEYKATKNYSIGNYVIVNDALYKVTSAIASGASITPGTNCTQTTVAEQLILLANA